MCVFMYICIYTNMYIYIYVYHAYVNICINMYIYIHIFFIVHYEYVFLSGKLKKPLDIFDRHDRLLDCSMCVLLVAQMVLKKCIPCDQ